MHIISVALYKFFYLSKQFAQILAKVSMNYRPKGGEVTPLPFSCYETPQKKLNPRSNHKQWPMTGPGSFGVMINSSTGIFHLNIFSVFI